MGLATSFFDEGRDSDLAPVLVKTLLETNQPIPEFLEQYIPEGFVPGEGDVTTLNFENDSDNGEGVEEGAGEGADEGAANDASGDGAWGTTTEDSGGWGTGAAQSGSW